MKGSEDAIQLTRTVSLTPAEAFELWTTPEHVKQWWSPSEDGRCTRCEIDLRIGKEYRLHVEYLDHRGYCNAWGRFLEIQRPHKLVYTWNAETYEGEVNDTVVTVEFVAVDGGTEIRLTHEGLPGKAAPGHRKGWTTSMARFDTYRVRRFPKRGV